MTNNTTVRVTKAQKYTAIISLLEGNEVVTIPSTTLKDGTIKEGVTLDADYLAQFCRDEMEALAKKNASKSGGSKKATKAQEETARLCTVVLEYLATQTEPLTCTQILGGCPEIDPAVTSNSKLVAVMKVLTEEAKVVKTSKSGKNYYELA